jgi:hypothetical protein
MSTPMKSFAIMMEPVLICGISCSRSPPRLLFRFENDRQTSSKLRNGLHVLGRVGVSSASIILTDIQETGRVAGLLMFAD